MKEETKGKSLLKFILIIAATVGICILGYITMPDIKLGLDLDGGVSITYQTTEENPSQQDMDDTIYKLQKRAEGYSSEAEVYQEGSNRINIDIPGVSDANEILEELGKPGSLQFCEASYDEDGNLTGFDNVVLDGTQVKDAQVGMIQGQAGSADEYEVGVTFTDAGAQTFAEVTERNVGKPLAIVYDNEVVSAPMVNEAITGGQCSITGGFTYEEATNLASTIRLAASIALSAYVGLILVMLNAFEITLTLPGVAGIVLSIGMAVDANVIIFTRIKEEIGVGKSVGEAIHTGFHKALSAIIDGNVTTIIAAAVLYFRGSGTVRGFAQTLALGVILSMFTALFVTRWILHAMYGLGCNKPGMYGIKKPVEKPMDFGGKRKICYTVSALVIACGLVFMGMNKANTGDMFNYGLDFKGGTSTNVTFNEDMSLDRISAEVAPVVTEATGDPAPQTQKVAGTNEVIIKTHSLDSEQRDKLNQALADSFGVDQEKITAENISGAVSGEMKQDAVVATAAAALLMLLYIWFRFKNIRFASSAVLALIHDVMVVVTCYAVLKWSVGSTFIACALTIVGYSINATIVIFDRIREHLKEGTSEDVSYLVDLSVTETLSRSVFTSLTTFVMVLCLYILGVSSVREFALPLMVGIVCGAYSSVCITGPLWNLMNSIKTKKDAEKLAAEKAVARETKASGRRKKS